MNLIQKLGTILLLVAILSASNVHLGFTQCVAWATMLYDYQSSEQSVSKAVEMTFNGDNPCDLCSFVQSGLSKEEEDYEALLPDQQIKLLAKRPVSVILSSPNEEVSMLASNFVYSPLNFYDTPEPPPKA